MHPFLNDTKLTDEEIIEKLGKAYNFMHQQKALGHTPTVISIQEVIDSLENERQTRMIKSMNDEANKKNPNANKPIELGKLED